MADKTNLRGIEASQDTVLILAQNHFTTARQRNSISSNSFSRWLDDESIYINRCEYFILKDIVNNRIAWSHMDAILVNLLRI